MARRGTVQNTIITFFTSAFLGAAAALLLVTCLTTPTRNSLHFTRVVAQGENGEFTLDLGSLGGCSGFLQATTGNEHDVDCRSTSAGYIASILLPPDTADLNITDATPASEYPYTLTFPYEVVTYSMTRPLVMVPIATASGILAMLLFIGASYMPKTWLDLATAVIAGLAMILAWASFGVAYKLTDRVRGMLEEYNSRPSSVGFQLDTERGNATWILLAAAVLLTLAVPMILYRQRLVKKADQSTPAYRKGSRDGEETEMA